jgi:hypothetical protein
MTTATDIEQGKVRTTLYLTQENRQRLDRIPRGQKTALMNRAIANALEELEREENAQKFLNMLEAIQPVTTAYSSQEMVRMLREGNEQALLDNKNQYAK